MWPRWGHINDRNCVRLTKLTQFSIRVRWAAAQLKFLGKVIPKGQAENTGNRSRARARAYAPIERHIRSGEYCASRPNWQLRGTQYG